MWNEEQNQYVPPDCFKNVDHNLILDILKEYRETVQNEDDIQEFVDFIAEIIEEEDQIEEILELLANTVSCEYIILYHTSGFFSFFWTGGKEGKGSRKIKICLFLKH